MTITRTDLREAISRHLDTICRMGDAQDYYLINHASGQELDALLLFTETFLQRRGVGINDD